MPRHYLLIDFENVQPVSVGALNSSECHIKVFAGEHQHKIDLGLVQALQPFGSHAEYIQIVGNGKDALDFHIAFYIGKLSAEHPDATFTIVSRDTGFDPLVKHLTGLNLACKRISAIDGSPQPSAPSAAIAVTKVVKKPVPKPAKKQAPKPAPKPNAAVPKERLGEVLQRLQGLKAARPGTVKTLRSSLKAWFKPALAESDVNALLAELGRLGKIKVAGTKVTYSLTAK